MLNEDGLPTLVAEVKPPIPFHTRVCKRTDKSVVGTVMPHNPEFSNGKFPVSWDRWGGMWEPGVTADEVDIVEPTTTATVTRLVARPPVKRKATLPKRRAVS